MALSVLQQIPIRKVGEGKSNESHESKNRGISNVRPTKHDIYFYIEIKRECKDVAREIPSGEK
tara:strand:+ start:341 stop:529 length:189 start_codon:yes stop_codon:yes gene_type:complete